MHTAAPTPAYTLELRQRFTAVQNRYDVVMTPPDGTEQVLAYVEQRRFALKERVTFYTDDTKRQVAFSIGARNVVELAGTYDVVDADGRPLGTIAKQFGASLLRSTYELQTPGGSLIGRERNAAVAILRRLFDLPLPIRFDLTAPSGVTVATVDRRLARVRDLYVVHVHDPALDWRLAAALAVAQDAFLDR